MSDKFNGFSQDEIIKASGVKPSQNISPNPPTNPIKRAFRGQHNGIRRLPDRWSKSVKPIKRQPIDKVVSPQSDVTTAMMTNAKGETLATNIENSSVILEQHSMNESSLNKSLSKSIEEALFYQPFKDTVRTDNVKDPLVNSGISLNNNAAIDDSSILKMTIPDAADADDSSILLASTGLKMDSPFKGISLKDFEAHRKLIEEQNKQKKQMLYKAIEQYSQKTAAEVRKIEEIRTELAKLDNDLAVDVAILRKQIDSACINFVTIEKQYMKIEQQFLKAKIDLHNAAEKKELLTEHLCTVISHNEDRKAQKLSELMAKVGLSATGEYTPKILNIDK